MRGGSSATSLRYIETLASAGMASAKNFSAEKPAPSTSVNAASVIPSNHGGNRTDELKARKRARAARCGQTARCLGSSLAIAYCAAKTARIVRHASATVIASWTTCVRDTPAKNGQIKKGKTGSTATESMISARSWTPVAIRLAEGQSMPSHPALQPTSHGFWF
jgi:hypothetical protein